MVRRRVSDTSESCLFIFVCCRKWAEVLKIMANGANGDGVHFSKITKTNSLFRKRVVF